MRERRDMRDVRHDALACISTRWQLVALAAALGWASGMRLYAVLFIVGAARLPGLGRAAVGPRVLAHPSCSRRRASCASSSSSPTRFRASIRCGTACRPSSAFRPARRWRRACSATRQRGVDAGGRDSRRLARRHQPLHQGRRTRGRQHFARAVLELGRARSAKISRSAGCCGWRSTHPLVRRWSCCAVARADARGCCRSSVPIHPPRAAHARSDTSGALPRGADRWRGTVIDPA